MAVYILLLIFCLKGRKHSINAARKLATQAVIMGAAALPYALMNDPVEKDTKT